MNMKHGRRVFVALLAGMLLVTAPVFAQGVADPFGQPLVQVRSHPAYYVWVDQAGWHVRWATTFPRLFSGFVASDGEIRNVRRAGGGSVSWLARSGLQRAVFATVAFSGIDGFDFEATGWNVTFSLLTNTGATRPDWIFIGRNLVHPGGAVFTLVVNPLLVLQGGGREPILSDIDRPVDRDR
jgi:hypothetical protein